MSVVIIFCPTDLPDWPRRVVLVFRSQVGNHCNHSSATVRRATVLRAWVGWYNLWRMQCYTAVAIQLDVRQKIRGHCNWTWQPVTAVLWWSSFTSPKQQQQDRKWHRHCIRFCRRGGVSSVPKRWWNSTGQRVMFMTRPYYMKIQELRILIEDIQLCFNTHNKTNSLYRQEHNNSV